MADVTDQTFETDVMERSKTVTVVVDLWAEWCGPCKTLGPILEKVIDETDGVELVKVDVDSNPSISRAFQVQSIPAVYALKDGKVVDGFVGAQPEAAVREFVTALAGGPKEPTEVERLVELGDEDSLRKALELEPDNEDAIVTLGEHLVVEGRADEALALLARIPESAETRRVAALARVGIPESDDDTDAQLEELLPKVKADEDARQRFVDLLELLGPDDPRTAGWRKRLTATLF
jgi:putative thioredoxin